MKPFRMECSAQERYQFLVKEFKNRSLSLENIKGYQMPRALGAPAYENRKNEFTHSNATSLTQNNQWIIWKNGQNFIGQMNSVFIKLSDVLNLHSALYASAQVADQGIDIGKIRTQSGVTNPKINYTCNDQFLDDKTVELINDYDLTSIEGHPLLSLENLKTCKDRNYSSGVLFFYKGASIKFELMRWITDLNDHIMRFENNNAYRSFSPSAYLADMRRWFLALSPFNSGNTEMADALIDYASRKFGLPPLALNDELSPLFISSAEYRENVTLKLQETLVFLEKCLLESKKKSPNAECSMLK